VIVEYLFLKGYGGKFIHKELVSILQDKVISVHTLWNSLRRFTSGDLSSADEEGPGRSFISLVRLFTAV
jgi:hypothetical protein